MKSYPLHIRHRPIKQSLSPIHYKLLMPSASTVVVVVQLIQLLTFLLSMALGPHVLLYSTMLRIRPRNFGPLVRSEDTNIFENLLVVF